jgi:hypothetical protein
VNKEEKIKKTLTICQNMIVDNVTFQDITSDLISQEILDRDQIDAIQGKLGNKAQMEAFMAEFCKTDLQVTYPKLSAILKKYRKTHVLKNS